MAKDVAWFIGDPDEEIQIQVQVQTHRNEYSVQPKRILVVQQPCSKKRIQLRDRRQVRVDSERLEFENRTKEGVLGRAMDSFRYGYLCCLEWMSP
jgi:hypothetical protein